MKISIKSAFLLIVLLNLTACLEFDLKTIEVDGQLYEPSAEQGFFLGYTKDDNSLMSDRVFKIKGVYPSEIIGQSTVKAYCRNKFNIYDEFIPATSLWGSTKSIEGDLVEYTVAFKLPPSCIEINDFGPIVFSYYSHVKLKQVGSGVFLPLNGDLFRRCASLKLSDPETYVNYTCKGPGYDEIKINEWVSSRF